MEDGHPVRLPEQQTLGLELGFEEKNYYVNLLFSQENMSKCFI